MTALSRRGLLAGAGVLISFRWADALAQPSAARDLGDLGAAPMLDAWLRLTPDGRLAIFSGKADLGQGLSTALVQIVAEELDLSVSRISLVAPDTALTPDEGMTTGSTSVHDAGTALLFAAANLRMLLIEDAARRWRTPAEGLVLTNGVVVSPTGRRLKIATLAAGLSLHSAARSDITPKAAVPGRRDLARLDLPAKLTGGPAFIQDLRLPGMLHARVIRAASHGSRLDVDPAAIAAVPASLKVVRNGRFVAVLGKSQWQVIKAMRALQVGPTKVTITFPDPKAVSEALLTSKDQKDEVLVDRRSTAPAGAGAEIVARYSRPYLMHASLGPSCAVAQFQDGVLTVWTHTEGVFVLRKCLAELIHLPLDRVRCIHMPSAGSFGHNGADDVAGDAAVAAMAVPGAPVRMQWMREQEHGWESLGAAMASHASGAVGPDGRIAHWDYQVWSYAHDARPRTAGRLMAGAEVDPPFRFSIPTVIPLPAGDGHRNAVPIYDLPDSKVTFHFAPHSSMRVSTLQCLGAHHNVFAIESFIDELALTAKADPVAFRINHLPDPRGRAVVAEAARRFGWQNGPRSPGVGRGFAYARYENLAAHCAVAMEATVDPDTGRIRVGRVVAAVDCGRAASIDGVRNVVEASISQSLSWTLQEETRFTPTGRTSFNWATYPMLRFPGQPAAIEVTVLDQPAEGFLGVAEAAQGPAAAALANAIADAAKGVRLRDMPFTPDKVKAALATRA